MEQELIRQRHLPHWDVPGATYFVTACLEGSIPAEGLLDIARYETQLRSRARPAGVTEDAWNVRNWKLLFVRQEQWLDLRPANRSLERPDLARAVVKSMYHFAGQHYDLFAYVVMPSHFHWLFRPRPDWVATIETTEHSARERIMYSLKRFTANACNRLRGVRGTFWQQESYDHWVRDSDEMERIIHYIEQNPVKSGLVRTAEDWEFGSGQVRKRGHVELGTALTKEMSGLES
jgi:REP element-mobilizing transposase RayT